MVSAWDMWDFGGIKMTREEAKKIVARHNWDMGNNKLVYCLVDIMQDLGLIKFEEEKKEVRKLCSAEQSGEFNFRVEQWYEKDGSSKFVLWYDGRIVWESKP